jgi:hypothetical protein
LLPAGGYSILESPADGRLTGWIPVADDLITEFQPLTETRKRILKDPELLNRATSQWLMATSDERTLKKTRVPPGFRELTDLLAWWCDASPFSIDPGPLCSVANWLESQESRLKAGHESLDSDEFWVSKECAIDVINRMRYAAAAGTGMEPPKKIKGPGRPLEDAVAERREAVVKLVKRNLKPGEIEAELRSLQQKGELTKDALISVAIVKKDIERVRES